MGVLAEILSRIDPRANREPDLSALDLPDLPAATRTLKLLWRRHEDALQRERVLRLVVWIMVPALIIAVAL